MGCDLTPQELAAKILVVAENGEHFDMRNWFKIPELIALAHRVVLFPASAEPGCGTTMCVAGWAAHLTGWDLVREGWNTIALNPVTREKESVSYVAMKALGLEDREAHRLFHEEKEVAIVLLRQIAEGRPFNYHEAVEEVYEAVEE